MTSFQNPTAHTLTRHERRIALLAAAVALAALLLPRPWSGYAFVGGCAVSLVILVGKLLPLDAPSVRRVWRLPSRAQQALASWPALRYGQELACVLLVLVYVTTPRWDFTDLTQIHGREFSYLVGSGALAGEVFRRDGAIPLWNPLMRQGEPLIESPFSYVLNPFMTAPVLVWGAVVGAKIAVLLHFAIMAVGGWTLAYALGLGGGARMFLALVLGGSGSMAGMIGEGFYQMSLSQAYLPWLFAGVIGTLRRDERVWPALLAVAGALLLFAGTYWHALPAALVGGGVVIAHPPTRTRLARLAAAGAMLLGLSAVRVLPQIVHHAYVWHPAADLEDTVYPFSLVARAYFVPQVVTGLESFGYSIYYHYILPPTFALAVLPGVLLALRRLARVILPAAVGVLVLTVWAQEGTPVLKAVYSTITFISEWRFTGRVMAVGAIWLAVLAAIGLDELLWRARTTLDSRTLRGIAAAALVLAAAITTLDVTHNLRRTPAYAGAYSFNRTPFHNLRDLYPGAVLSVLTPGFHDYLAVYEALVRVPVGNPDYYATGRPSTLGLTNLTLIEYRAEFAIEYQNVWSAEELIYRGYLPFEHPALWHRWHRNWQALPYAFVLDLERYALTSSPYDSMRPAQGFAHQMDRITFALRDVPPQSALVVQETAYPGWQVWANGERLPVESVGGVIGVRLPAGEQVRVTFVYWPAWLMLGGGLTLISATGIAVYLVWPRRQGYVIP